MLDCRKPGGSTSVHHGRFRMHKWSRLVIFYRVKITSLPTAPIDLDKTKLLFGPHSETTEPIEVAETGKESNGSGWYVFECVDTLESGSTIC